MDTEVIYLDHAAATPLDSKVLQAMQPYFSDAFYNPSAPYAPAIAVRREYEAAKQVIAQCIGAKGDDIIITAGVPFGNAGSTNLLRITKIIADKNLN